MCPPADMRLACWSYMTNPLATGKMYANCYRCLSKQWDPVYRGIAHPLRIASSRCDASDGTILSTSEERLHTKVYSEKKLSKRLFYSHTDKKYPILKEIPCCHESSNSVVYFRSCVLMQWIRPFAKRPPSARIISGCVRSFSSAGGKAHATGQCPLKRLASSRTAPHRVVQRAQIMGESAQGETIPVIALQVRLSAFQVRAWIHRFH
jgi:hypothetical protein